MIPLRHGRTGEDGTALVTRIIEGMTEHTCDGKTGYGLSEDLDQIVEGLSIDRQRSTEKLTSHPDR